MNNINNDSNINKINNQRYNDKDFDGIPDNIDSCFDPPVYKETKIADEKKHEDEKKKSNNLLMR